MRTYRERLRSQSGMALVGVMLLLILASGVCAALAVSGKTETMAAYNLDTHAQARAAAQAGLTAAAEVLIEYLENNTTYDVKTAMTRVLTGPDLDASTLGDNGSLWSIDVDGDGTATPTGLPNPGTKSLLNNITGVSYEVVALDDDNWTARGGTAGSSVSIGENDPAAPPSPAYNDYNRRIVVRAVGHGRNNTTVTLEGIISRPQTGGIVVGASLKQNGTPGTIDGYGAGMHANRDLIFSGSPQVIGPVSAVGTITGVPVGYTSLLAGQDPIDIPPINASDFLKYAGWYLTSTGTVRQRIAGVWVNVCTGSCTLGPQGGVSFVAGAWRFYGTASGQYFVDAEAKSWDNLHDVSIYATGTININSGNNMTFTDPSLGGRVNPVALVSDGTVSLGGGQAIGGSIYARENIDFGGFITITGQVVAENRSDPAYINTFNGEVNVHWDGDTMIGNFGVSSWREVK